MKWVGWKNGIMAGMAVALILFVLDKFTHIKETAPTVAIIQDKPQEWADALKIGFDEGLREEGLVVGRDYATMSRSAAQLKQSLDALSMAIAQQPDFRVVYTLGTQASQAALAAITNKPIIFGAVTDPVGAGLFDQTLDKPKGNITGTQDNWPYKAQFDLIQKLLPSIRKMGVLCNPKEQNSQASMRYVREEAKIRKIELVVNDVEGEQAVPNAVNGLLADGVEAVYIPADNTVQTQNKAVIDACTPKKIPVFSGIPDIVKNGALATVGIDYYQLGRINARQTARILRGAQARFIHPEIANTGGLYINIKAARTLGINIPQDLLRQADAVYPEKGTE